MQSNKRVWIIEGDASQKSFLKDFLDLRYETTYFDSFAQFCQAFETAQELPELILTDIRHESGHFYDIEKCERFKESATPVLILTSIDELDIVRFCFSKGAKDYLLKPMTKNILIAKIDNIFNEKPSSESMALKFETRFDELELTIKEIKIMKAFLMAPDRIVNRQTIVDKIWRSIRVHHKTLDVHLYNLRKKLGGSEFEIKAQGSGNFKLKIQDVSERKKKSERSSALRL